MSDGEELPILEREERLYEGLQVTVRIRSFRHHHSRIWNAQIKLAEDDESHLVSSFGDVRSRLLSTLTSQLKSQTLHSNRDLLHGSESPKSSIGQSPFSILQVCKAMLHILDFNNFDESKTPRSWARRVERYELVNFSSQFPCICL